ncbi:MAG: hypothetical protein LBI67_12905 [Treponema sp.]|jgi:hypothetical protein|nr:hypothetical protein [Treponema sp.]
MGLLHKAVSNDHPLHPEGQNSEASPYLGEMGTVLRDRLLALSGTPPETAISLLKAYGSFRAGACLSLDNGTYRSYAAVGIGNTIELSPDLLRKVPGKNFYAADYNPPKRSLPGGTKFWAFSLDEDTAAENPAANDSAAGAEDSLPDCILLVGEDKNYIFHNDEVGALVQAAKSAFRAGKGRAGQDGEIITETDIAESGAEENDSAAAVNKASAGGGLLAQAKKHSPEPAGGFPEGEDSLPAAEDADEKKFLPFFAEALEKHGAIQALVFGDQGQTGGLTGRISGMVSGFADTAELRNGCLVSGGQSLDGELLAARLSASIPCKTLAVFSAENPGEALSVLRAYL